MRSEGVYLNDVGLLKRIGAFIHSLTWRVMAPDLSGRVDVLGNRVGARAVYRLARCGHARRSQTLQLGPIFAAASGLARSMPRA